MKKIYCPKCGYKIYIPKNSYNLSKDKTIVKYYETRCPKCGGCVRIALFPSKEEMFNIIFNDIKEKKLKKF